MWRDLKLNNKLTNIIILLVGIIFNIVSVVIIHILASLYNPHYIYPMPDDPVYIYMRSFVIFSIFIVIVNALPIKLFKINTDGRKVYQLIRYEKISADR